MQFNKRFYLAPDPGAPAGGEEEKKEESVVEEDELKKAQDELKKAQDELAALKQAKAEEEKAREEEAKAKMSDEEKLAAEKAEYEKMKAETLASYKAATLQKAGVGEEYVSLISGTTQKEIAEQGELLSKLVASIKSETEASVKKAVAKTGAPGSGEESKELSAEDFYKGLSKGAK